MKPKKRSELMRSAEEIARLLKKGDMENARENNQTHQKKNKHPTMKNDFQGTGVCLASASDLQSSIKWEYSSTTTTTSVLSSLL